MFFKQLTKRERILSYLAVLVLSSFFAYTYVIEPVREYLQNLNQQIMIKELRAKKNLKILAKKERVLKEYEKVAERWKGKGSLEEEMTDTLKEIESQARETGLNIIDIKPQLPEVLPPGHYRELFIIVESECKIGCLIEFMYKISASSQALRINKLRLKAKGGDRLFLEGEMVISRII